MLQQMNQFINVTKLRLPWKAIFSLTHGSISKLALTRLVWTGRSGVLYVSLDHIKNNMEVHNLYLQSPPERSLRAI